MTTQLSKQETDQAMAMLQKLKLHDLSAIIQALNLRKPRAGKQEAVRAVQQAIFDPEKSRAAYMMMFQFQRGFEMSRPRANQPRNHPYPVPPQRNNNMMGPPNGMNMMAHHMQFQNFAPQMHHPMQAQQQPPVRYGDPQQAAMAAYMAAARFLGQHHQQHQQQQEQRHANRTDDVRRPTASSSVPSSSLASRRHRYADKFDIVPLPFYDNIMILMNPVELPAGSDAMKTNKTLNFAFHLTAEQTPNLQYHHHTNAILPRHEVQMRFFNITEVNGQPQKDEFPLNVVVRVDENSIGLPNIIPTNKPNVEPKRPSRPVNITPQLRISNYNPTVAHRVQIDWTSDRRTWAVMVNYVFRVDSKMLYDRVNNDKSKHKSIELTTREVRDKLTGSGEEDIAMDHLQISLLDPLIKTRMVTPSRCRDCTHLQCFDLMSYLMMNEKKPTWQCPVCSNYCPYDRLIVDDYFLDLLNKVDKSTTEVELKPDGSYDIIGRDEEVCLSDDDDDEEDIKQVVTNHHQGITNGNGAGCSTSSGSSTTAEAAHANGGKKRKAPAADPEYITLSDSDDDLSQGILNSLNDFHYNNQHHTMASSAGPVSHTNSTSSSVIRTPPRPQQQQQQAPAAVSTNNNVKKSKVLEVITLDDTPPRPVAQQQQQPPMRQMSQHQQQNHYHPMHQHQPTSSSGTSSNMPTISDALSQIGHNDQSRVQPQQPQPLMQAPGAPPSLQYAMNNANAASAAMPTNYQQFGYPVQMMQQTPQHYALQNGLIGRNNQMVPQGAQGPQMTSQQQQQQQQHQQQQQGNPMLSPQQFYGQNAFFYPHQYHQQYRQN